MTASASVIDFAGNYADLAHSVNFAENYIDLAHSVNFAENYIERTGDTDSVQPAFWS